MMQEQATFAGGCFWCTQHDFDLVPGLISTTVGYTGGTTQNPTYGQVCTGKTGHVEAIRIVFNPHKISYRQLLDIYWHTIDPTRGDGQFCDIGSQYRPMIFYHNEEQHQEALASKNWLLESRTVPKVAVDILPAMPFFPAEEYHQKYYQQSPVRYKMFHYGSGRAKRLRELWGP
jgi:peptide-methionine (S)-S-oxide reductase